MKRLNNYTNKIVCFLCLLFISSIQFEVIAQSRQNLALNKPTKQSRTTYGGLSKRANDGNTNGEMSNKSVSHTEKAHGAYWQVDLRGLYEIEEVRIWNRVDCCSDRLSNFDIWVTQNDMGHNEDVDPFASEPGNISQTNRKFYKVGDVMENTGKVITPKTGRFIRIRLNGKNNLHMAEVEVYGRKATKGKLDIDANINKNVVYSYTIYRNGNEKAMKVSTQMTKSITAGYNFDKKVDDSHKTYGELGMKSTVETNEIVAKASLEISAKFGAEHNSSSESSNGKNYGRSTSNTVTEEMTVPAASVIYVFNKFVLKEVPVKYTLDGEIYSWVNVLDQAETKDKAILEFHFGENPPGLIANDNQIITEKMFLDIYKRYSDSFDHEDEEEHEEDDDGKD